jgi:DNA-binding NtrC family response regulator
MTKRVPIGLRLLLVDDEPELCKTLSEILTEAGHTVTAVSDGAAALEQVRQQVFEVVITDVRLPKVDGLRLFARIRAEAPSTRVILMTAFGGIAEAVKALKEGAHDYIAKPFDADELTIRLDRIAKDCALERELEQARSVLASRAPETLLIGQAPSIRRALDKVHLVAESDAPALVTGESGTGKELVARMIHDRSPRRDHAFVTVNCGALPETLMEAELFGHERGAFTGADKKREGRFKAAHQGTIFLDEIAELSLPAQAKLLRVLQEGTFEPIGSNTSVKVDVRVVSATHQNLQERVRKKLFREDLYYRIGVMEIALPPLRERPGDLAQLVQHFLQRFTRPGEPIPAISLSAWTRLAEHRFPGNVRELSHAIQHAVVLARGAEITPAHLPPSVTGPEPNIAASAGEPPPDPAPARVRAGEFRPLPIVLRDLEKNYLVDLLRHTRGNVYEAAALLQISGTQLMKKLKEHAIPVGVVPPS